MIIMIVDDNPADIGLLTEALADARIDCETLVARDGAEAMEVMARAAAERRTPAVIVLDLNMPKMNGRELLARLKQDALLVPIPVIVLTSSTSPRDRADCLAMGAAAFLGKPRDLQDLDRLVLTIIAHAGGARDQRERGDPAEPRGPGLLFMTLAGFIRNPCHRLVEALLEPRRVGSARACAATS